MNLDLRQLRYFKAVADLRSFTQAASELHIAQSALSMSIKKLEAQLGLQLLHRHERQIGLTDEGQKLYRHATRLLQNELDARREMEELRGLERGEVRIGMPSMLGSYFFPPILMAFHHRYPTLNFVVIEGGTWQLQQMLEQGKLDLAIIVREFLPPQLEARSFLRAEMRVCCHHEHPFADLSEIPLDAFFAEELAMFQPGFFHRKIVDRLASERDLTPRISFETNLIALIKSIVRSGFGITTLLDMVIADEPELISRPFEQPVWLDLCIGWRKNGYLSQANRTFVEFLLEQCEHQR